MKDQNNGVKKLKLKKENLRVLSSDKLNRVQGAAACCAYGGTAIRSASIVVEPGPEPVPAPGTIIGADKVGVD